VPASTRESAASPAVLTPEEPLPFDRRESTDRRRRKTPMFSRYTWFGGRRRSARRDRESRGIYVDRYSKRVVALFVAILVLNVLDAYFTLAFIQRGGKEANPVAQAFLDLGDMPFLLVKSVAIGLCLTVLVIHQSFYSVPRILSVIFTFYGVLLVYHLLLQVLVVPGLG
jgi:hypothetical protein